MISTIPSSIPPDMMQALANTLKNRIQTRIRQGNITPKTQKEGNRKTLVTSGKLVNSIQARVGQNAINVGSNLAYARIHQEGGTIVPKKAKYLAIPLTKAARVLSPRDFENTFILNGVIFMNQDGKPVALYALKKSVTIPKRPYLFLDSADNKIIAERIRQWFESKK